MSYHPEFLTMLENKRNTTSVLILADIARKHGMDIDACLLDTGISRSDLFDTKKEILAHQEIKLIENIVTYLGSDESFTAGLEAGLEYHLTSYGVWGFGLVSSATLRDAIELGLTYIDLTFAFTKISLAESDEEAFLVIDAQHIPPSLQPFLIARDMFAIYTMQREIFGDYLPSFPIIRLELIYPNVSCNEYIELLLQGSEICYGAEMNRAVIHTELLSQTLPQANFLTYELCEKQCEEILNNKHNSATLTGVIRNILVNSSCGFPSMESVSDMLNINVRTLRRRLKEEGTTWRDILNDARESLAEKMLATEQITIEEIAERLDYSEVSNFTHAFKKWKGMTPSEYRKKH